MCNIGVLLEREPQRPGSRSCYFPTRFRSAQLASSGSHLRPKMRKRRMKKKRRRRRKKNKRKRREKKRKRRKTRSRKKGRIWCRRPRRKRERIWWRRLNARNNGKRVLSHDSKKLKKPLDLGLSFLRKSKQISLLYVLGIAL